jgi:hypothetical protein
VDSAVINIPQEDEIVISLVDQKLIVHDTVRIQITVVAQRDPETPEETVRSNIRQALGRFIPANWRFASVTRNRGPTRFEQVSVVAVCRATESENQQLDERAARVSTTDIQLMNPQASFALPFEEVQKVNRELRIKLTKQAKAECDAYNAAGLGTTYRIGEIVFADTPRAGGAADMRAGTAYARQNVAQMAYAGATAPGAPGGVDLDVADTGPSDLGVTERFWVAAQVTLRANKTT